MDPLDQIPNTSEKASDPVKREASIHTMKTDVAGYLKKEKPSLISIISRQEDSAPFMDKDAPRPVGVLQIIATGITILIFAMLGYAGTIYYQSTQMAKQLETTGPIKFFSTDKTVALTLKQDRGLLLRAIKDESTEHERDGLVKQLAITLEGGFSGRTITPQEFFSIADISTPPGFLLNLDIQFMPFISYSGGKGFFGAIARTKSTDKTFASMLAWEGTIQKDFNSLYLGRMPEVTIPLFEDKTYKNIHYRFVQLSPSGDFGIGYFVFPTKSFIVITTSEDAIGVIISRLLDS